MLKETIKTLEKAGTNMFQVKNKDNKTGVWFTSKDYPSQLFFQYKELPLQQETKQSKTKKTEIRKFFWSFRYLLGQT